MQCISMGCCNEAYLLFLSFNLFFFTQKNLSYAICLTTVTRIVGELMLGQAGKYL